MLPHSIENCAEPAGLAGLDGRCRIAGVGAGLDGAAALCLQHSIAERGRHGICLQQQVEQAGVVRRPPDDGQHRRLITPHGLDTQKLQLLRGRRRWQPLQAGEPGASGQYRQC